MFDQPGEGISDCTFSRLTGRVPEPVDEAHVRRAVQGRVLMITGAGGSVGMATTRLVGRGDPAHLVLVDRCEAALDRVAHGAARGCSVSATLADVRDPASMRRILGRSRVDAVIHVAAHKHVPMAESQPVEYIRNNVFGTQVILEAAQDAGASQFLLVSTDKAARPSGVMGRTKWIAERLVLAASTEAFTCAAVRFGNVLGSSGSVLQRFQEQVAAGDPLLITDPQMTRYFMTPTEAAYTIVLALAFADGGDLCSIDLGAPVAIGTLADRFLECVDASTASRAAACAEVVGRRRGERTHEHPPRGDRLGQTSLLVSREPRCSPAALTEAVRALEEICREEEPPAAAARLEQLMEPLRMARGSALSPQA